VLERLGDFDSAAEMARVALDRDPQNMRAMGVRSRIEKGAPGAG